MSAVGFSRDLSTWLERSCGLDSAIFGERALADAIHQRRTIRQAGDIETYARLWHSEPTERQALLDRLLVGETWFFREWSSFARLDEWARARLDQFSDSTPLQVLSLPCASGEEAWSIAALLWEAGYRQGQVVIDAIDISQSALDQASTGLYPARRLRVQDSRQWSHLLEPLEGSLLHVADCLRGLVRFRQGNAMDQDILIRKRSYHIIFCRNMLIYMSPKARSHVFTTLYQLLRPQGLLFLGHTESAPQESGFRRSEGSGAFAWRRHPDEPDLHPVAGNSLSPARPLASSRTTHTRIVPNPNSRPTPKVSAPTTPCPPILQQDTPQLARESREKLDAARHLANQGCHTDALAWLESPEGNSSLDAEVHCLAGVLLAALAHRQEASGRFRRALYLKPDHEESLTHLALLLEQMGDTDGASRLRSRLDRLGQGTT